jgi:hypothetical protein
MCRSSKVEESLTAEDAKEVEDRKRNLLGNLCVLGVLCGEEVLDECAAKTSGIDQAADRRP